MRSLCAPMDFWLHNLGVIYSSLTRRQPLRFLREPSSGAEESDAVDAITKGLPEPKPIRGLVGSTDHSLRTLLRGHRPTFPYPKNHQCITLVGWLVYSCRVCLSSHHSHIFHFTDIARPSLRDICPSTSYVNSVRGDFTREAAKDILGLILGLGKHIEVIPPADIIHVIKGVFASEFLYTSVITCVKYSILCFYWRIFSISSIKLPIYILGTIITGWSLACVGWADERERFIADVWNKIFTAAFQCIPTAKLWDIFGRLDGHCINVIKFFIGNAIPNIITDVALLILPLPHIWRLQVPGTQKLFVLLAFIFGGA